MDQNNNNQNNNSENSENKSENPPVPAENSSPLIPNTESNDKPVDPASQDTKVPQNSNDNSSEKKPDEPVKEEVKQEEPVKVEEPVKPEGSDNPLVEDKKDPALDALNASVAPASPDGKAPKGKGVSLAVIIVFLVISFLSGLLLAGMYFQNQLQQAKVTNEASEAVKKVIIIGTNATDPPMESVNSKGALVGYDIDLGYRIANEMGVKAEFQNLEWDGIFQKLLDKKVDMIMASVTITDERKKLYAFSEPYINAGQVIISRKDKPITTVEQLQGKKISVQKDTTNEKEAYKYTSKDMVQVYTEYDDIAKAVSLGSAEAALSDLTIAKGLITNYENVKITSDPFTNEYYGIVMRKDDKDLQKKVNAALSVLRVNGVLTDLKQKWLE